MKKDKKKDGDVPRYLFHQGANACAYEYFGSHPEGENVVFRVWAPNAQRVTLAGDFNDWDAESLDMTRLEGGTWEVRVPGVKQFDAYKYCITGADGVARMKADPFAFHAETRPANASKYYDLGAFDWEDASYRKRLAARPVYESPVNIYELHAGSWRLHEDGSPYSYRDLADALAE